jgi:hypothetical protein
MSESDVKRVRYDEPPPLPQALVDRVVGIVSAHPEIRAARLRVRSTWFDTFEVARQLELAVLLEDPPTTPDGVGRELMMALFRPLHEGTGVTPSMVAEAGVNAFHKRGALVYERPDVTSGG